MAWVYLDADFPEHPKLGRTRAPDNAGWLFVCVLAWCRRHGTDGLIPVGSIRGLTGLRNWKAVADDLVAVGLLESADDQHLRVHDWEEWNRPAIARSEAGRKAAAARWGRQGNANAHANALPTHMRTQSDGNAMTYADRCPYPYPLPRESSQSVQDPRAVTDDDPIAVEAQRRTAARPGVQNPAAYAAKVAAELRANPTRGADVNHTEKTAAAAQARYDLEQRRRAGEVCDRCEGTGMAPLDDGTFTDCDCKRAPAC